MQVPTNLAQEVVSLWERALSEASMELSSCLLTRHAFGSHQGSISRKIFGYATMDAWDDTLWAAPFSATHG
eukprot:630801-Amphidinium_carterae.1